MSLLERVKSYFADDATTLRESSTVISAACSGEGAAVAIAIDRYRYLLRTVSAGAVEEVHAEALATLAPQQRHLVFVELSQSAAAADRPAFDDPRTLAHSAIRSEQRQPGFLERTLSTGSGASRGLEPKTVMGGSLLGTVAVVVIGSAIANMLLPGIGDVALNGFGDLAVDI